MIDRVLVPLDGSRIAERALGTAANLVRPGKGTVLLFHAFAPPIAGNSGRTKAEKYLGRVAGRLRRRGIRVEKRVAGGEASRQIVRASLREPVDMIVIAGRGKGASGRGPLGSVAERVLRTSPVPVLLVRGPIRKCRILIPLGGRAWPLRALVRMAETARPLGATVSITGVGPARRHLLESALDVFARLGVPYRVHPHAARFEREDLITIPVDVHEGERWSHFGNRAEKILGRADASLLTVPIRNADVQILGA